MENIKINFGAILGFIAALIASFFLFRWGHEPGAEKLPQWVINTSAILMISGIFAGNSLWNTIFGEH